MSTRRTFLANSAATAAASRTAIGANDRIRFAIIGAGTRGSYVGGVFAAFPDVECVAVCDVYKPTREQVAAKLPGKPEAVNDYRKVLDRKDVDAVLIATPDHWHGPMVMEASAAGKDSYCEKPVTHSIEVGLKMIEAARRYKRVVQIGLQQRSWQHFQENAERVQKGMFGPIHQAQCVYLGNYLRPPEVGGDPPPDLDWNLFQGPAERRQYTRSRQRTWKIPTTTTPEARCWTGRALDAHRTLVSQRQGATDGERVGPIRAASVPATRSTARLGCLLLGL